MDYKQGTPLVTPDPWSLHPSEWTRPYERAHSAHLVVGPTCGWVWEGFEDQGEAYQCTVMGAHVIILNL